MYKRQTYNVTIIEVDGKKQAEVVFWDICDFSLRASAEEYAGNGFATTVNNLGYTAQFVALGDPYDITMKLTVPLE